MAVPAWVGKTDRSTASTVAAATPERCPAAPALTPGAPQTACQALLKPTPVFVDVSAKGAPAQAPGSGVGGLCGSGGLYVRRFGIGRAAAIGTDGVDVTVAGPRFEHGDGLGFGVGVEESEAGGPVSEKPNPSVPSVR